jgi:hypothetical protein
MGLCCGTATVYGSQVGLPNMIGHRSALILTACARNDSRAINQEAAKA